MTDERDDLREQVQDDPLAKLFVSGRELDLQLLADTIVPYIKIYLDENKKTVEIRFTPEGSKLTAREKLLAYLLGRKAVTLREYLTQEGASPGEIEKETGIPGGTIRPTLKRLSDEHLVRDDNGYTVPSNKLLEVHRILSKGTK